MKYTVAVLGILLAAFSATIAQDEIARTEQPKDEWKQLLSPNGGFLVDFPQYPKLKKEVLTDEYSGQVVLHMIETIYDSAAYLVTFAEYPEEVMKENGWKRLLANAVNGVTSTGQVQELVGSEDLQIYNTVGKEIRARLSNTQVPGGGTMRARFFVLNSKLYQMAVIVPGERALGDEFDRFFNSFKLTDDGQDDLASGEEGGHSEQ